MAKNSSVPRLDILSLNLKDIKRSLPSAPQTKLVVSNDDKDATPLNQSVIKPWMLSVSNQVLVSRNKIGNTLLQRRKSAFILDDPNIRRTRFFVDYHRLHDPALRRYYHSTPVRNRLKKLKLISTQNDAICTHREFVEYLRYLDRNQNLNQTESDKIEVFILLGVMHYLNLFKIRYIGFFSEKGDFRSIFKD